VVGGASDWGSSRGDPPRYPLAPQKERTCMLRVSPRALIAALVFAGLASVAVAQDDAAKPPQPAQTPAAQPVPPPVPAGIPVPEGPVVHKQELEGGLIIEDIKIGDGYEVKPGGAVVALYHGTLKEGGKIFDSAFQRGEPIAFPLNGVIPGWQKGVPGMKVGGVRKLTIPAAMAYGAQSPSPDIPANSDLVFVIQLVDAIQVEDLKVGEGEEAFGQFVAVTTHTIMDKDGAVLEKVTAEKPYIWFPNEFQGISFGLDGMKAGGKRRIKVPKEMNLNNPQAPPTNRPTGVPLVIDVDLIAVRNLQPRR